MIAKPRPKTVTYIKDVADFEQDVQEKIDYLRKKMLVTRNVDFSLSLVDTSLQSVRISHHVGCILQGNGRRLCARKAPT